MTYEIGDRVIIHRESPHTDGVGVLGEVLYCFEGTALGGGDVAAVKFQDPVDGRDYERRLHCDQLVPATVERLQAMAKRHEGLVEELHRLAEFANE